VKRLAEFALIGVAAIWGLTFVMVQDAIALLPAMTFLAYRFIAASVLLSLPFWRSLCSTPASGWWSALTLGVFLTAGYVFQTLGLQHTSASNAGFITGLFVVITPLFGRLLFRQRLASIAWSAAGVSALGLFLLTGAGRDFTLAGDGLVLACACAFALHILFTDRAVRDFEVGPLVAIQLGVCGLFCLLVAGIAGDLEVPHGWTVWSALLVTSLLASALAFLVQTYAQQQIAPARTALILAAEPAFAGLFGFWLGDERLSAVSLLGALLIVGAIVAVDAVPRLRPPRPLPEG
jgi:drug/metabolite transporter (DMT)-like permease